MCRLCVTIKLWVSINVTKFCNENEKYEKAELKANNFFPVQLGQKFRKDIMVKFAAVIKLIF